MLRLASAFWASACPAGLYGKNCQHSCLCRNGGSCDPILGQCACPEGWTGLACENGELSGLGGRHPSGEEDGLSRGQHARGGWSVFPSTQGAGNLGWCLLDKAQSRELDSHPHPTLAECLPGHYGAGCQLNCSCLNGGICDRLTGHCRCPAGWTGDKCQNCEWGLGSWEVLPRVTRSYSVVLTEVAHC